MAELLNNDDLAAAICYEVNKTLGLGWSSGEVAATRAVVRGILRAQRQPLIDTPESAAWKKSAEQFCRNAEYYQELIDEIGKLLGPEAYRQDDGGVSEDILRAKVPEVVRQALEGHAKMHDELRASERRLETERDALRAALDAVSAIDWTTVTQELAGAAWTLRCFEAITMDANEGKRYAALLEQRIRAELGEAPDA